MVSHGGGQRTSGKQKWLLVLVAFVAVWGVVHFYSHGVSAETQTQRYVVQQGDTVWAIALREAPHADPRSVVGLIEQTNHLKSTDEIQPGQVLLIPGGLH